MKLQNIFNDGKVVYLFNRNKEGILDIVKDSSFMPFFYEKSPIGDYTTYDNNKVRKVIVSNPSDIRKMANSSSYSSDIPFIKNYLINKVKYIEKTTIKAIFIDIEVLSPELPVYTKPKYPISCVTIYNTHPSKDSENIRTYYIQDYDGDEVTLLKKLSEYIFLESPDILLAWNMENFDYPYLYARYNEITGENFAQEISPISKSRYSPIDKVEYPAGISILDYLQMFKKVFMREASYALDFVAQKHLGEKSVGKTVFKELNSKIKEKNIIDVLRMTKLEEKYKIIPYFDEIRRLAKCNWEDLYYNSYIIEMLLLEEAKLKNIVVPNKPKTKEESTFEGATRECIKTGALFDIGKFDLTSAYPNMIINFCLDGQNISSSFIEGAIKIGNYWVKQNKEALLPSLVSKLLKLKDDQKKVVKNSIFGTDEYTNEQRKYDAIKAVVNSAFGVMGYPGFRIYDNRIASIIAYLVRDLLMFVKDKVEYNGYKVIYWDTDSLFLESKEDITDLLNAIIQQWANEKYNKDYISIEFECEGYFEKVFLLTKCRYYGYISSKKGVRKEIKGMEMKRSSSSKYEGEFQQVLLDKILNKEDKESIIKWIDEEKKRIKTLPLNMIGFPCKIGNREYKGEPIFIRAYNNTKKLFKDFNLDRGDLFYYIYIKTSNIEDNVIAFNSSIESLIPRTNIDFEQIIRRNIIQKSINIFESMGWNTLQLLNSSQMSLF